MKIQEYNQMMRYLLRPGTTTQLKLPVTQTKKVVQTKKKPMDIVEYIQKNQELYDGIPMPRKEVKKGGVIKDPTFTTYNNGGKAKNKKNIKVAMSESPQEEAEIMLNSEALEFMKWLKKNPNKTYNDWLKSQEAFLTDEQKKDKKIIDITPLLPTFQEEIQKMEEEKKQEEDKDSDLPLEKYIVKRAEEIRRKNNRENGLASILLL